MLLRPVPQKAFTLLELIVVIVILGLLAALAIPTFARVTKKSQDATTATTLSAVLRDARALVAFQDGTTWEAALEVAAKETAAPVAAGTSAAAYHAPVTPGTVVAGKPVNEPAADIPVYVSDPSQDVVSLSLRSPSGNVCVALATRTSTTTPTCAAPLLGSGSSARAALNGDALSDGTVVPLPAGVTPVGVSAPAAVTGVSASAGAASAVLTWNLPSWSAKDKPTSLEVISSSGVSVPVPFTGTVPTTTTLTELPVGAPLTFTVKVTNSAGSATSVASAPATPYAAPLAPSSFASSALTSSGASLSWIAAGTRGTPVTGYSITATPSVGTPVTVTAPAGATGATLTGLSPSTSYVVTLKATSAGGDSAGATTTFTTTTPVPPEFNTAAIATTNPSYDSTNPSYAVDGNPDRYWSTAYSYDIKLPLKSPAQVSSVLVNFGVWGCQSSAPCGNGNIYINNGWSVTTYSDTACSAGAVVRGSNTLNGTYPGATPNFAVGASIGCVQVKASSTANWLKLREVTLS
jgi:prepilin-type N-terminal cleavage/methylation domain-containing protein